MKANNFKFAILLYVFSGIGLVYYLFSSFSGLLVLAPILRMMLLVVLCICAYFGSVNISKTSKTPQKIMKATFCAFFLLYLWFLITLVCFDSYFGRVGFDRLSKWNLQSLKDYFKNSFNIIPFKTILRFVLAPFNNSDISAKAIITNLLGNLAAFSPFAFFLPLLFKKLNKFGNFVMAMIAIVTVVELLQFALLTGCCDIDDLILNVGGAVILFLLLKINTIDNFVKRFTKCKAKEE